MTQLLAGCEPGPAQAAYTARLRRALSAAPGRPADAFDRTPVCTRAAVLRLMAQGLTYQEAAEKLIVSLNTIRFHVKSIYGKLGVDNRTAAIEKARSLDLL